MQRLPDLVRAQFLGVAALTLTLFAAGCGAGVPANSPISTITLRGNVHGGQQPVSGSSIQLYAAGASGYGTGATALLNAPVTTDSSGSFTITGQYTCPSASSQIYIVATGGNPGLSAPTNNTSLALMAALGSCSLYGSQYTLDPNSFININEVTTVASVYALAGFIDPVTNQIGASAANSIGIANAFQTVSNLINITSGQALATTPNGNGTVPQGEINTLANILSACVNSTGSGPDCAALFAAATPSGGTAPTNTLQATVNIAAQPAQQVATLFALSPPTPPFQPTLSAAPNDWTLALNFAGDPRGQPSALAIDASGNIWIANDGINPSTAFVTEFSNNGAVLSGSTGFTSPSLNYAENIAIDPTGNVWVGAQNNHNLVKLSSNGAVLSGPNGYTATGFDSFGSIALDGAGNAWLLAENFSSGAIAVFKFGNDGTILSGAQGFTAGVMNSPGSVAIDGSGDVWIANNDDYNVTELSNNGQPLSGTTGFPSGGLSHQPQQIAFDAGGNAWVVVKYSQGNLIELNSSGVVVSPANGFPVCTQPPLNVGPLPPSFIFDCEGFGVSQQPPLAIDGGGNVWVSFCYTIYSHPATPPYTSTDYFGIAKVSNSGTILSGPTGYATSQIFGPISTGIDSSGNIWGIMDYRNIEELIGVASPVVTPLSVAVKNNTLGTRP